MTARFKLSVFLVGVLGLAVFGWITHRSSTLQEPPLVELSTSVPKLDLDNPDALAAYFDARHTATPSQFNGVVLVRRADNVLLRRSYGTDAQGRALIENASMRLGSISK